MRLARTDLTWDEFVVYIAGLLACDSRLARHLRTPDGSAEEVPDE